MPYTSLVEEEQLVDDEFLRSVPGIYQELVEKHCELRVTIMGRQSFSAKILSQETVAGRLDWRKAYGELTMEPIDLPGEIMDRCQELLKRLGLVFGCLDFIVRPDGDLIFLEVNEMGQFLFVESYTGLPLLDAFAEFLLQGTPDFDWNPMKVKVRYDEIVPKIQHRLESAANRHVQPPIQTIWEDPGDSPA